MTTYHLPICYCLLSILHCIYIHIYLSDSLKVWTECRVHPPSLFMQHNHFLKHEGLSPTHQTLSGGGENHLFHLSELKWLTSSNRATGTEDAGAFPSHPPTLQGTTKGKQIPQTTHSSTSEQGSKTWSESWAKIPVLYCAISCRLELCCKAARTLKTQADLTNIAFLSLFLFLFLPLSFLGWIPSTFYVATTDVTAQPRML